MFPKFTYQLQCVIGTLATIFREVLIKVLSYELLFLISFTIFTFLSHPVRPVAYDTFFIIMKSYNGKRAQFRDLPYSRYVTRDSSQFVVLPTVTLNISSQWPFMTNCQTHSEIHTYF